MAPMNAFRREIRAIPTACSARSCHSSARESYPERYGDWPDESSKSLSRRGRMAVLAAVVIESTSSRSRPALRLARNQNREPSETSQ
jgi:predicted CxxxxCH...CXXCH cytochrome family protein